MRPNGTRAADRRPDALAAFVRPTRLDRLEQPDHRNGPDRTVGQCKDTGPRWNALFQLTVMALAVVLAVLNALTTYELIHQIRTDAGSMSGKSVNDAIGVAGESAYLALFAAGIVWMVLTGRWLRRVGRSGSQLRLPSVVAFMVMPLVLCATNLFANDAGRDAFNRPEANFPEYAITACGIRIMLAIVIAWLAVAARRGIDRLMSEG